MSCLTSLMNERYGGSIKMTYAFELVLAPEIGGVRGGG